MTQVARGGFLPSVLVVKVMKFEQAEVNGGSNYDPLRERNSLMFEVMLGCVRHQSTVILDQF